MNWLFVTHDPWPMTNGTGLRVWRIAKELKALGDEVDLLTDYTGSGFPAAYEALGVGVHGVARAARCRLDRREPFESNPLIAGEIESRSDCDAVALFGPSALQYAGHGASAAVLADVIDDPVTAVTRRLWHGRNPLQWARRFKLRGELLAYEARHLQAVSVAAFVSEYDSGAVRRRKPPCRILTITNGVDVEYFAPPPAESAAMENGSKSVVFVGNFEALPNRLAAAELVRHVAPRVWRRNADARFVFVGPRPPAWLRAAADDRLLVTGMVDDVRPLVRAAAVVCLPMTVGTGIKNKFLEAWAMGRAVAASPLACQGLPVEDGRNALVARSRAALADAVCRLLEDSALRTTLGRAGRATVERAFRWSNVAESFRSAVSHMREPLTAGRGGRLHP